MHRAPFAPDTSGLCVDPLTTHQLLFQVFWSLSLSCAEAPALCTGPTSPGTAPLSRRGFSGSFAPSFLICTNFPRSLFFFFLNPATPTHCPFPSLCIHPGADGPAWLGRFCEAPSLHPFDHLFGSPRPRRTNGRPEGRHRRGRSCSRATWAGWERPGSELGARSPSPGALGEGPAW